MSDTTPSHTADRTVMMIGACLLFLGGLLIGIPVGAPGAPIIGMAHTLGLLEAVFMLAFVALRPLLRFSAVNAWLFCALTIVSFYCNFAGVCVTVLTGAGGGMFLPPWDAYLDNTPSPANAWVAFLLNTSTIALILPLMLLVGWVDRFRQSEGLQRATTVVAMAGTIILLVWAYWFQ
ncbi:hypothetical protein [Bauldia sp.]|uniref:hypothetical protein n=1 Tax=Bauldia sp. TaxID=2575872 RepID=UPI003BABA3F7